ncbi:hypothetical protein D3C76_1719080 [compost metagenome]
MKDTLYNLPPANITSTFGWSSRTLTTGKLFVTTVILKFFGRLAANATTEVPPSKNTTCPSFKKFNAFKAIACF